MFGGVGGMTVMAILAFTMRQVRDGIAAECPSMGSDPMEASIAIFNN